MAFAVAAEDSTFMRQDKRSPTIHIKPCRMCPDHERAPPRAGLVVGQERLSGLSLGLIQPVERNQRHSDMGLASGALGSASLCAWSPTSSSLRFAHGHLPQLR